MELIYTCCDKCKKTYPKEKCKTTKISYSRYGYDHNTFDLCDTCLEELISSISDQKGDLPLNVPGD